MKYESPIPFLSPVWLIQRVCVLVPVVSFMATFGALEASGPLEAASVGLAHGQPSTRVSRSTRHQFYELS